MNNYNINCQGTLLDLSTPKVMGILNLTPDSFYDGGQYTQEAVILKKVEQMLEEGAEIIDIGGMSSRPGAAIISLEEELKRVIPPLQKIKATFPDTILSIDTVRAKVARESVAIGVGIVNDISAGQFDSEMFITVGELGIPYILMHMQGRPETMQTKPHYNNIIEEVVDFFIKKTQKLRALQVNDIILDVGFGFGKTLEHNYELLNGLSQFRILDLPILAGLSRKSMIWKLLKVTPKEALNGTSVLHFKALEEGASLLRVHDVKAAKEVIQLWGQLKKVKT